MSDVCLLRAAGADEVVLVGPDAVELRKKLALASRVAMKQAREREQRVSDLSELVQSVRAGTAEPRSLITGIGMELLERPMAIMAKASCEPTFQPQRYRDPDVMATLRASIYVLDRVHALQARERLDAVSDVATVAEEVMRMLTTIFDERVGKRFRTRGGPFLVALPDWCIAVIALASGLALATTGGASDSGEPIHVLQGPDAFHRTLSIEVLGGGSSVFLEISTDLTDVEVLMEADLDGTGPPPTETSHSALALAAACACSFNGSVMVEPGLDAGAVITVVLPAA